MGYFVFVSCIFYGDHLPLTASLNVSIFVGLWWYPRICTRYLCTRKCCAVGYYCQICMTLPGCPGISPVTIIELCSNHWFTIQRDSGGDIPLIKAHIKVTDSRVRPNRKPDAMSHNNISCTVYTSYLYNTILVGQC